MLYIVLEYLYLLVPVVHGVPVPQLQVQHVLVSLGQRFTERALLESKVDIINLSLSRVKVSVLALVVDLLTRAAECLLVDSYINI